MAEYCPRCGTSLSVPTKGCDECRSVHAVGLPDVPADIHRVPMETEALAATREEPDWRRVGA